MNHGSAVEGVHMQYRYIPPFVVLLMPPPPHAKAQLFITHHHWLAGGHKLIQISFELVEQEGKHLEVPY